MKTYKITIKIYGLTGVTERVVEVKAKTEASARKKGYAIIGNQDGQIISIVG